MLSFSVMQSSFSFSDIKIIAVPTGSSIYNLAFEVLLLKTLLSQNGYPTGVVNYSMNDVLQKQQNKPLIPTIKVPKKKIFLVLPFLGCSSSARQENTQRFY